MGFDLPKRLRDSRTDELRYNRLSPGMSEARRQVSRIHSADPQEGRSMERRLQKTPVHVLVVLAWKGEPLCSRIADGHELTAHDLPLIRCCAYLVASDI